MCRQFIRLPIYSPVDFFFLFSAGKPRLIDNDSSLVNMALSVTKIIVSSSRQRVSERSPSYVEDFEEKLIKKGNAFIFSLSCSIL